MNTLFAENEVMTNFGQLSFEPADNYDFAEMDPFPSAFDLATCYTPNCRR
jgi:hypothetical protein